MKNNFKIFKNYKENIGNFSKFRFFENLKFLRTPAHFPSISSWEIMRRFLGFSMKIFEFFYPLTGDFLL